MFRGRVLRSGFRWGKVKLMSIMVLILAFGFGESSTQLLIVLYSVKSTSSNIVMENIKWEYKALNIEGKYITQKMNTQKVEQELNILGNQGWELVAAIPVTRTGVFTKDVATYAFSFLFKRPLK